ncbi:MAG: Ig-like domain-containing protein, partial [Synergistaceae bacterium]|nr:Ig-like domain-containing protein [Synergistaceae bacterium]
MRRKYGFYVLMIWLLSSFCVHAPVAEAVMAEPSIRTHVQADGTTVYYQAHGDEFFDYLSDSDGNLVVFGDDGDLYIGRWVLENDFLNSQSGSADDDGGYVGRFVVPTDQKAPGVSIWPYSTNSPVSESSMQPLKDPVPEYILDDAARRMEERDESWRLQFETPVIRSLEGFDESAPASSVERKLLIIYVDFSNDTGITELSGKKLTADRLYDQVFNDTNFGSISHYYKTVTGGGVKYSPAEETDGAYDDGIIHVTLSGSHANWRNNYNPFRLSVVIPALSAADPFINYKAFDTNNNNIITSDELSIIFIVHGYESSAISSTTTPSLWGHAASGFDLGTLDGANLRAYCAFGAFHTQETNPRPFTPGIVVHELGHHSFGFLDLYSVAASNTSATSGVSGSWSVMGQGSWATADNIPGSTPTCLDAYHLSTILYPTAAVSDSNNDIQQFSLTGSSQFIKLETSVPEQYFLLQPRGDIGYDRGMHGYLSSWGSPGGGLMIYHIDERNPRNSLGLNWTKHPLFDIEEAHGGTDDLMQDNITNGLIVSVAPNDLFFGSNVTFDDTTDPNSKLYDAQTSLTQNLSSGKAVTDISPTVTSKDTPIGRVKVDLKVGTVANTTQATGITLNRITTNLNLLDTETLIATVSPDNASDKRVTWSSDNTAIATVNDGLVTAVGIGSTVIRATSVANGSVTSQCTVYVASIPVVLQSAIADGSAGVTDSTKIKLTFDRPITGLTADKINIANG